MQTFTNAVSKHLVAIVASMAGGALAGGAIVLTLTTGLHATPHVSAPVAVVTSPSPAPSPTASPTPPAVATAAPVAAPTAAPAPARPVAPVAPASAAPPPAPMATPSAAPPPPPPQPTFQGVSVSATIGKSPLPVTWHVAATTTGSYTIRWTINRTAYTTNDAADLTQTLGPGTFYLTCVIISDTNGRAAVVLVSGPKVVVDDVATSTTGGCV